MKAKIIALANQKGGVGKTTTAVTLSVDLARRGYRVLLVDFDPQGQCAPSLGMKRESCVYTLLTSPTPPAPAHVVRETGRENLHIIPGDQFTGRAQNIMNAEGAPFDAIAEAIQPLAGSYDYVFFDTAPSLGGIQERAIWASSGVIVPTSTQYLSSDGLGQIMRMLSDMQGKKNWKGYLAGILPTFYEEATRESAHALKTIRETFGGKLVLAPIHRATALSSCPSYGLTITEKDPGCRAAIEYLKLAELIAKSKI